MSNQSYNRMSMKKSIYIIGLVFLFGFCSGCGKEAAESDERNTETLSVQIEEQSDAENRESDAIELKDIPEINFGYDYSENIKSDIDQVVLNSASLQKELENIDKIIQKYTSLAEAAQTQGEMNISSRWLFVVWDTELNNLWSRFCNSADQQTKETILEEQRNWVAMKEEVTVLCIGSEEENGSMYPLLQNSFLEEITKDRVFVLANELAKIKGETFVMPDKSEKYGMFVDNQGTGSTYSFLNTCPRWEEANEAVISIYKQGKTEGTFVDNGSGELDFTSDDGSIKGIIKINGWDGASFRVTETSGTSAFSVGEEFEFPFAL